MKLRYRLFQRSSGIYFIEDRITGKQQSLRTRDRHAAKRIFNARNESYEQPAITLQIARAYLMAMMAMATKSSINVNARRRASRPRGLPSRKEGSVFVRETLHLTAAGAKDSLTPVLTVGSSL